MEDAVISTADLPVIGRALAGDKRVALGPPRQKCLVGVHEYEGYTHTQPPPPQQPPSPPTPLAFQRQFLLECGRHNRRNVKKKG